MRAVVSNCSPVQIILARQLVLPSLAYVSTSQASQVPTAIAALNVVVHYQPYTHSVSKSPRLVIDTSMPLNKWVYKELVFTAPVQENGWLSSYFERHSAHSDTFSAEIFVCCKHRVKRWKTCCD